MKGQAAFLTARGWLSPAERHFLRDLAADIRGRFPEDKRTIVNVGVEYGASLHCLRAGDPEATLIGVDLDTSRLEGDPGAELWEGDSGELGKRARRAVHLLFVDGGHTHPVVDDDLRYWGRRVVGGGLLVAHDYSTRPMHREVVEALDAWYAAEGRHWRPLPPVDTVRAFRRREEG